MLLRKVPTNEPSLAEKAANWLVRLIPVPCLLGCAIAAGTSLTPVEIPAPKIARHMEAAAKESISRYGEAPKLFLSGMAFLDGDLWITSNFGLFQVQSDRVRALHYWKDQADLERPFVDPVRKELWLYHAGEPHFIKRSKPDWKTVPLPKHPTGGFSRRDIAAGFVPYFSSENIWIVGGGRCWEWDDRRQVMEPFSSPNGKDEIVAIAKVSDGVICITGTRFAPIDPRPDPSDPPHRAFFLTNGKWEEIPGGQEGNKSQRKPFLVEGMVLVGDRLFARGVFGDLFEIQRSGIDSLDAPGLCEAIAGTSSGFLLCAFRGKGIQEYRGKWRLLFPDPPRSGLNNQIAFLAEDAGLVSYGRTEFSLGGDVVSAAWMGNVNNEELRPISLVGTAKN